MVLCHRVYVDGVIEGEIGCSIGRQIIEVTGDTKAEDFCVNFPP